MKKIVIVFALIIVLLLVLLLAIPVVFKGKLLKVTQTTINKHVNATVEFENFSLSVFKDFPQITVGLQNVSIVGKGVFNNDTLLSVPEVTGQMNLVSLFTSSSKSIRNVVVSDPLVNLLVDKQGNSNWDITYSDGNVYPETNNKKENLSNPFELQLEQIEVINANINYIDNSADLLMEFTKANLLCTGNLYGSKANLNILGDISDLLVQYDSVNYISNTTLTTKSLLEIDYENITIGILENELVLNDLPLQVLGSVQMPSDSMFFDLKINSKESGFNNFMALIPPQYDSYFEGITTSGMAEIIGSLNGWYFGEDYPAFQLALNVKKGSVKYQNLPDELKNIEADILINKAQGILNLTEASVLNASVEVKNNPVKFSFLMNDIFEDVVFNGALNGKINFDHLKDAIPFDSIKIAGIMDVQMEFKGKYSDILNKNYGQIKSDGSILLKDINYASNTLREDVKIPNGDLVFSPQEVNLKAFEILIGRSDLHLKGSLSNYLNYLFNDDVLKGQFQLTSRFVNLNELLTIQSKPAKETLPNSVKDKKKQEEQTDEILAFDIPSNIMVDFRSNIQAAQLHNILISNIIGTIKAENGKLNLDGLDMNMLGGELTLNGSYENSPSDQPLFDFNFKMSDFEIPILVQSFSPQQTQRAISGQSSGKINSDFKLSGRLNPQLKIIPSTFKGIGLFQTVGLQFVNSGTFNQMKGVLKQEKLKNVTIDNFTANFLVQDGNLLLKPFKTEVAGQEALMKGSLNVQSILDLTIDFNVKREAFGDDIQSIIGIIPGQERIKSVPVTVLISGPVGEPEVKLDFTPTRKYVTEQIKNSSKEDLQKSLNKIGNTLKKLFK